MKIEKMSSSVGAFCDTPEADAKNNFKGYDTACSRMSNATGTTLPRSSYVISMVCSHFHVSMMLLP